MAQSIDTAKSFDITTAAEDQAQRKYDQNTPYRLLLKSLPYAVPMGAAATSLAIDGARAFRYGQQALLSNNGFKKWLIE